METTKNPEAWMLSCIPKKWVKKDMFLAATTSPGATQDGSTHGAVENEISTMASSYLHLALCPWSLREQITAEK